LEKVKQYSSNVECNGSDKDFSDFILHNHFVQKIFVNSDSNVYKSFFP
jgi:hypothetical protein